MSGLLHGRIWSIWSWQAALPYTYPIISPWRRSTRRNRIQGWTTTCLSLVFCFSSRRSNQCKGSSREIGRWSSWGSDRSVSEPAGPVRFFSLGRRFQRREGFVADPIPNINKAFSPPKAAWSILSAWGWRCIFARFAACQSLPRMPSPSVLSFFVSCWAQRCFIDWLMSLADTLPSGFSSGLGSKF
jgi:hypothetical protein